MIDVHTGAVVLDGAETISSSTTLPAFMASAMARGARSIGVAADARRFHLGIHTVFGDPCSVVIQFHRDRLRAVVLDVLDPDAKGGADDYDVGAALATKARLDGWLAAKLGPPPYRHPWGTIECVYDPRSVSSSIFVTYA